MDYALEHTSHTSLDLLGESTSKLLSAPEKNLRLPPGHNDIQHRASRIQEGVSEILSGIYFTMNNFYGIIYGEQMEN
jgi:hypothetical protein